MKKSWIVIGVIIILVLVFYGMFKGYYNNMVTKSEEVESQWSQVENVYQRRADLIPNLVNTVKGYAEFEQQTLTDVIEARSKATAINIAPGQLSAESLQQFQAAQEGLSSALSKLMVVVERYPELKANQGFLELQAQLEGTENRIAVERRKFTELTRQYNTYVKKFPQVIFARLFGFGEKPYFEAAEGAETVPEVQF